MTGRTALVVAAHEGEYDAFVAAFIPADDSPETVGERVTWTVDERMDGLTIRITDETVSVESGGS